MPKPPSDYIRENLYVTTSGVCSAEPLQCALSALGEDRVMFSVDYPFENPALANDFIETTPLPPAQRENVAFGNAARLLNLDPAKIG